MATRNVDPELARLRTKLGNAVRYGHPDVEEHRAALRDAHIRRLVKELAAGLTDEKRAKLVALFAPVEPSTSDGGDE